MNTAPPYKKLLDFSTELLKQNLNPDDHLTYIEKTLNLLDSVLGFETAMMASLSNSGQKAIAPNLIVHKVPMAFAQQFLTECWNNSEFLLQTEDLLILSQTDACKKSFLYQNLLKPYGYTDLILQFIRYGDCSHYLSYIVYLTKTGAFQTAQKEALALASESIAIGHLNSIHMLSIRSRMNLLVDYLNYHPTGILFIANASQVAYANELARTYLADLGIMDPRLYSTFYANKLYPYHMQNLRVRKNAIPIRIGRYLFQVVSADKAENCPARKLFESEITSDTSAEEDILFADNITARVYIIDSSPQELRFSTSILKELGLTNREQEIVEYLAQGKNNQELADTMGISENTVKTHLSNIYRKLGINYRSELIDMLYRKQSFR